MRRTKGCSPPLIYDCCIEIVKSRPPTAPIGESFDLKSIAAWISVAFLMIGGIAVVGAQPKTPVTCTPRSTHTGNEAVALGLSCMPVYGSSSNAALNGVRYTSAVEWVVS